LAEDETVDRIDRMARLNRANKDIRRVLEWLLNRDVPDTEIGTALGMPKATYSRRKEAVDYPNFAELTALGEHFGLSARVLQIAFGWRGEDELVLLDVDEMHQYMEQAGAALFSHKAVRHYVRDRGEGDHPLATAIRKLIAAQEEADSTPLVKEPSGKRGR
jgi:hypothetical protein